MTATTGGPLSAFQSPTFDRDVEVKVDDEIGAASISPAGRDIVLASKSGLRIIDLDNLFSLPRFIPNQSSWDVADVQWSPFAARAEWIATTRNQLALVYNLSMPYNSKKAPIEYTLRAHERAITDINFSAHHPDLLATCGVDSFVFIHDLRSRQVPLKLADYTAGATQVKWNRQNDKIIASAHDKYLHIWDTRHGATPLSTIAGHSTKIYGIDWNRNDPSKIMTCSLDATIKLWNNVGKADVMTVPRRVIRTHYPVWRARHTPFPHGILAMPQRGNSNLWLYKHVNDSDPSTFNNEPVHAFQKHDSDAQVREFLWRSRGSTDYGIDNRDFQLISWGTDRRLQLHHLDPKLLEKAVGYRKGDRLIEEPSATRKGATYVSYRDGPIPTTTVGDRDQFGPPRQQRKGNLSTLLQNYSLKDEAYTAHFRGQTHARIQQEAVPRETMTAQPIRRNDPRVVNHITWINGVKFGGDRNNNVNGFQTRPSQHDRGMKYPYQEQNDLGAEISYVGNKYKKLAFEEIDVPGRYIKVSFNGPWGDYDPATDGAKLVFLRFTIRFPSAYPKAIENGQPDSVRHRIPTPLDIEFERTTASISREHQEELVHNMHRIAATCAEQEREALEAVLSYALGERALDDSLDLGEDDEPLADLGPLPGESSSEDEDHDGEFTDEVMQSSHMNANVPLPIQCTARFSADGSLVVARIPPVKSAPESEVFRFQIARNLRQSGLRNDIFDSFGRFTSHRAEDSDGGSSPSSSIGSWETSSAPSSSSGSGRGGNAHIGNFQPPLAWQKSISRFQSRNSLPSSGGVAKQPSKTKSTVSILFSATDDLVPSKRVLAEEYRIFGPGPIICEHNSEVARRHGFDDLADIWTLCKLILSNEVPVEVLPQQYRRDQVLVLARRALIRMKRKDSGLDLTSEETDNVTNTQLNARVKWGHHSVVTWLIPSLFEHFERLADVQMLAMLSCIFAEPAAREDVASAMAKMRQSQLPMSMEAPAFSLDYFSSQEAAWSLFKPTISVPPTPSYSRFAITANDSGSQRSVKNSEVYGSHGSSNEPWNSDAFHSDPVTPYSTGNTPPLLSQIPPIRNAQTANHTPYGTSPESSHTAHKKSSTANFASAVAALSRPFSNAMSSSPPVRSRIEELSTSAPTGGVTWGTTTFYGSDSHNQNNMAAPRPKHGKRASFGQSEHVDINYICESDSDYEKVDDDGSYSVAGVRDRTTMPSTPRDDDGDRAIKIILKNQDQFDDEACFSRPLLDSSKGWLHRIWREQYAEMLNRWGLVSARAEVLKFNGLVSYFATEETHGSSKNDSVPLALKRSDDDDEKTTPHISRASSTLAPPTPTTTQMKRSSASPKHFSFNPEATEFQPSTMTNILSEEQIADLPMDAFIPPEQYLRLSIPIRTPTLELDESLAGLSTSPGQSKLQPPPSRSSRPSVSRGTSNVSGASSWRDNRPRTNTSTTPFKPVEPEPEPVYSCSICWIRVSGLFHLCPACGHVAHMDCMGDETGVDEGECTVGCGCGCGLEDDDERSRMEAYIEGVRAAHAEGSAWEEGSEWLPSGLTTPAMYPESAYGDFMTGGASKMVGSGSRSEERRKEKSAAGGGRRDVVSPTPTKAKKKSKKKVRASGLSYY